MVEPNAGSVHRAGLLCELRYQFARTNSSTIMDIHLYTEWKNELEIRSVGHTPCAGEVSARIHELQSALITIAERLKKSEERIKELEIEVASVRQFLVI